MTLIRFLRLPNLIIIFFALTGAKQILYAAFGKSCSTTTWQLLTLATILITIGGNLINDYFDQGTDAINKPKYQVVGKYLSNKATITIYLIINALALASAYSLSTHLQFAPWSKILFPAVIVGLFIYSWKLKCTPLVGNMLVAIFCALVPLQIWWLLDTETELLPHAIPSRLIYYITFAFALTFWREMVKDLEDITGDTDASCKTLPVVIGQLMSQRIAISIGMLIFLFLCYTIYQEIPTEMQIWAIPALLAPNGVAIHWLLQKGHPVFYEKASLMIKLLMVIGLVMLAVV